MLASDGLMDAGQGHPRAAGTFPRFIDRYVKTGKLMCAVSIEAIFKTASDGNLIRNPEVKNMKSCAFTGHRPSGFSACQKMKSDIDVVNISNRHVRIDGKSIVGLMTIKLGMPMLLLVNGEDEGLVEEKFSSFLAE